MDNNVQYVQMKTEESNDIYLPLTKCYPGREEEIVEKLVERLGREAEKALGNFAEVKKITIEIQQKTQEEVSKEEEEYRAWCFMMQQLYAEQPALTRIQVTGRHKFKQWKLLCGSKLIRGSLQINS